MASATTPDTTGLRNATVVHPDGTRALTSVTALATAAELVVVLGPSGSGKSTLLRAVAGLAEVRDGDVLIGGRRVNDWSVQARDVALVFEEANLVPFLSVAENLALGLRSRQVPDPEVQQRVRAQARGLRLGRLMSRKPATLSVGEAGKVGIGRALVRAPTVFLFDEPLGRLDAAERVRTRRQIVDVVKGLGVASLYVTHDQSEALAIADRIVLLQDGRVVQTDTPRDLYRCPRNLFAAGFVGSPPIGLVPATVVVADGSAGYRIGGRVLPTWGPLPEQLRDLVDQPVVLGVRAEQVTNDEASYNPDLVRLPAVVLGVEYTGRDLVVIAAVDAPTVTAPGADTWEFESHQAVLRSRFLRDSRVRQGDTVHLAVEVSRAHVFDATTGEALVHPQE